MKNTILKTSNSHPILVIMMSFFLIIVLQYFPISISATPIVYKFNNAEGKTQFNGHPPKNKDYEILKLQTEKTSEPSISTNKSSINTTSDTSSESHNNIYHSQMESIEAQQQMACDNARQNKNILLSTIKVSVRQPDGSEKILNKQEKLVKLKEMDQAIKDYCSSESGSL